MNQMPRDELVTDAMSAPEREDGDQQRKTLSPIYVHDDILIRYRRHDITIQLTTIAMRAC